MTCFFAIECAYDSYAYINCTPLSYKYQNVGADIVQGQYLGKPFLSEGLKSLDRVVIEAVMGVLKTARRVAWHIDVGGGALCIRFYYLTKTFRRETHYVHHQLRLA